MIKVAVFDLDGTLMDTLTSIAYCADRSLSKEGLKQLPRDDFRYYAGDGVRELVRRYLAKTEPEELSLIEERPIKNPHDEVNLDYYLQSYMEEFSKHCMYKAKPFDGIPELIEELKRRGIKTAVLSNKPDAQSKEVVRTMFADGSFDYVQGQTEDVPRKPSPEGALRIAESFGAEPHECIYLGDTDTDMRTGKAAGMYTVGVLWGFRDKEELCENGADAIIETPMELLSLIKPS